MSVSLEKLQREATVTGFRLDVLEKVVRLLGLLNAIFKHPFLKNRFVLKGGTALNLFIFKIPRLSVDIDLNYIGSLDRETMLAERPKIKQAFQAVFSREGLAVQRIPDDHAGGKWRLKYHRVSGGTGNLEVDVNFMYRLPLYPVKILDSHSIGSWYAQKIPVLDLHELVAGKLAALLARQQARDLFDCNNILQMEGLDLNLLRIVFVVYGGMNRKDWREVSIEDIQFDVRDLNSKLVPMLNRDDAKRISDSAGYGDRLVSECRERLSAVLPFTDDEYTFLNNLLTEGRIVPELLTEDKVLQDRISSQPGLKWKALHVKKYKKG